MSGMRRRQERRERSVGRMKEARGVEGVDVGHGKVGMGGRRGAMGRRNNGGHLSSRGQGNTTAIRSKQPQPVSYEHRPGCQDTQGGIILLCHQL